MKRRGAYIQRQKSSYSVVDGKRFLKQLVSCGIILVLVLTVQRTPWSGSVQFQIQRLFGYEIDFRALGDLLTQRVQSLQEQPVEIKTEPVTSTPRIEELPPVTEPEKWSLLNTGRITSRYGERELNGVAGFHSGIDIAGDYGDAVYAIADGEVLACGVDEGYGNYIKIRHPQNDVTTLYGHLQTIAVTKGQQVTKGETIATIGSTGKSSGPHLHLEVRDDGNRTLDPAPYISY